MKILIAGNHACANRGDAAILRGLLNYLDQQSDIDYDILSRHPDSASYFMGKKVLLDNLHMMRKTKRVTLWQKLYWRFFPYYCTLLMSIFRRTPELMFAWLPDEFRQQILLLKNYDAVVQVGGSFFVDIYGTAQYDHAICAIVANKPLYMAGHSIGPFNGFVYRYISRFVFKHTSWCGLRESLSQSYSIQQGIQVNHLVMGADTAWLVPSEVGGLVKNHTVAITVRDISPFSQRLGLSQPDYEQAIANLADNLNLLGYKVIFFSTCTGIDGYANDDRMVAWRIRNRCQQLPLPEIEMRELNDIELGQQLARCKLTVATRLHSAIISMNFGTAAVALNYEHKSAGIYADMGLAAKAFNVDALLDGRFQQAINTLLTEPRPIQTYSLAVSEQREKAKRFLNDMTEHMRSNAACK